MMTSLAEFREIFKAPEGSEEALKVMTTEREREFIVKMKDMDSFDLEEASSSMNLSKNECKVFLDDCYKRGTISLTESGNYKKGELYCRLDLFAQFENEEWQEVPYDLRHMLDDWYVEEYGKRCIEGILAKIDHRIKSSYGIEGTKESCLGNDIVLPLEEALPYIDQIEEDIYVLPCNCRSIAMNCNKPTETCLQYYSADELNTPINRGWGRKISKEEAKEIVKKSNSAGLMQTVGDGAICNCDGCCCYPSRSSKRLHSKGVWPENKYIVQWDDKACVRCGLCVNRCNFQVFQIEKAEDGKRYMNFDSSKCWGCGLCVETCPKEALTLKKI